MQGLNSQQAAKQLSGAAQGYSVGVTASTSPRDKSIMDMAIDQLAAEISAAEINFQSLGDKLIPVRSAGTDICGDGGPSNGPNCELEERILFLARRVSLLSGGINVVTGQVCL